MPNAARINRNPRRFKRFSLTIVITSQELLTDPDYAPEYAKYVSTSRTGLHARYWVVTLREIPSTISPLV